MKINLKFSSIIKLHINFYSLKSGESNSIYNSKIELNERFSRKYLQNVKKVKV